MSDTKKISASPKVRKFARELGANINQIVGSERGGRVTEQDIKNYINSKIKNTSELNIPNVKSEKKNIKPEYEHSDFGKVEIKDIPRVKRIAAPHLTNSWNTIPHVTHHDEIDITELEEFRNSLFDSVTGEKIKITPLAFIAKALTNNLKNFPSFNSSIDDIDNGKLQLKNIFI